VISCKLLLIIYQMIQVFNLTESRKIFTGFQGIINSRAKANTGCVMLIFSRKIVYGYVMICTTKKENI
jgi:hypothetical protein